ncbi:hypothetical protein DPMN_004554 [Dreissena polymorpha]|uniref:Uncharacterized protein n=1 Tax=Dreissena polymorpha TaxID=45954 RepID=A0A9D4RVQ0_DREPO|nr:hypothetical protein DPMN_004554 [Dreissena polymorpha]
MDWFVENDRTCVNECRPTDFIEETLKVSIGPFIERKCVSECPKYTYNKTCLDICPIDNQLLHVGGYNRDSYGNVYGIYGNKICVDNCPESYSFKQNITYNGDSLTICTSECYKYIENGYCVNRCTNGSVIFNNTCVLNCHSSQPIANKDGVCRELCIPSNVQDSMCACPESKPFVLNSTCVDECDAHMFYRYHNDKVFCIETCKESEYILNRSCVRECPRGTFKLFNECLNGCPESLPYYCALNSQGKCDDAYYIFSCFEHCPAGMFVDLFACKHSCPDFTLNTTCYDNCPLTHPFIYNNVTGIGCKYERCSKIIRNKNCLDVCPVGYFKRRQECTLVCGNNEFVLNGSCLTECPYKMKSREFHFEYKELREKYYDWYKLETISQLTNKCVDKCESTEYQYNNTCVTACPDELPYATKGICSVGPCMTNYYYNMTTFIRCVDACDDRDFIRDKECLNVCPNSTFALKNHCVTVCPNETFMINNVKTKCENPENGCPEHLFNEYTSCIDACPKNTYILNNSCIDYCPENYVANGMNCLQFCPMNVQYRIRIAETIFLWTFTDMWFYDKNLIRQIKCSKTCPVDHFKRGDDCNLFCTSDEYVYNGTCYTVCPKQMISRKFTLEYIELQDNGYYQWNSFANVTKSQLTNKCVDACESNEYQYNNTCVTACPNDLPYSTKGVCGIGPCTTNYYYNMTTFIHCVDACDDRDFIRDKECLNVCPNSTFALKNHCVTVCPNETFMINNVKTKCENPENGCPEHLFYEYTSCVDACPNNTYIFNNTCKGYCPENYVANGMNCLLFCPKNVRYRIKIAETISSWKFTYKWYYDKNLIRQTKCSNICPVDHFKRGDDCNMFCTNDEYVYNGTCNTECPKQMISRKFTLDYIELQDNGYYGMRQWYRITNVTKSQLTNKCVDACESNEYQYYNTCVTACPDDLPYASKGVCGIGPCTTNYYYNMTTFIRCVNTCDGNDFFRDNECMSVCPNTTFAHNTQCVSVCPSNTLFMKVVRTKCENKCPESSLLMYLRCIEKCPNGTYVLNDSCVDYCPPENYVSAYGSCLKECPDHVPYKNETMVKINQWTQSYLGWNLVEQNKLLQECVSDCNIKGRPLDLKTSTCVASCPATYPYVEDNVCNSKCSNNFITNNKSFGIECVEKCPNDKFSFNNTCVTECTADAKYEYKGFCFKTCPSESRFGVTENKRNHCIKQCENSKLFLNGQCVYSYECKNPMFEFQEQCLTQCPSGYVYSLSQGCLNVAHVRTAIIVILLTLACICLYCWKIIRDCVWITYFTRQTHSDRQTFHKVSKCTDQHQVEFENFAFETEAEETETLL